MMHTTCAPRQMNQIIVPHNLMGTRAALFYLFREIEKPARDVSQVNKKTFSPPNMGEAPPPSMQATQPIQQKPTSGPAQNTVEAIEDEFVFY
jgi:hypothetical protein